MGYSTSKDISAFIKQAGNVPFVVSDMDGNVLTGYDSGTDVTHGTVEDSKIQSIAYDIPTVQLENMVRNGTLKHTIFASKRMDVRLSEDMVAMINEQIALDQPFRTAFLTSRGEEDTLKILRASGITHPEKMTLATDSGAVVWINGIRNLLREPTADETAYLSGVEKIADGNRSNIEKMVREYVPDFAGEIPSLTVEHKKIASNVHWRKILDATGQKEGSPLDDAIGQMVKGQLDGYAMTSSVHGHPAGAFMTLDGPMTVEFKLSDINKALGLEFIMKNSVAAPEHQRPTSIIFTGDDVANKKGSPGTDWFAMDGITAQGMKHGIPTFNIHTHHPEGNTLDGNTPDPHKSPDNLSGKWPKPPIHLRVPSPQRLVEVIMRIDGYRTQWDSRVPLDLGKHHV